jgi:hypothetical protein
MAKRYGGRFSPDDATDTNGSPVQRIDVDPVGGRANLLFVPPALLLFTSLNDGAGGLMLGLIGAGLLAGSAWILREGLQAEAAFRARKVARRPAVPRKILAALGVGLGVAFASYRNEAGLIAPLLFGVAASALHLAAFGVDPLNSKGMEGIDTFQQDRVARVVGEAERLLTEMRDAMQRAGDRRAQQRLEAFQTTARDLIRTVEEDPRDLTAARKYLSVYLRGARDATIKFADINARSPDPQARADYLALLDDLDKNFAARNRKSMLEDRGDLTVEIEVLRERLSREGVRFD